MRAGLRGNDQLLMYLRFTIHYYFKDGTQTPTNQNNTRTLPARQGAPNASHITHAPPNPETDLDQRTALPHTPRTTPSCPQDKTRCPHPLPHLNPRPLRSEFTPQVSAVRKIEGDTAAQGRSLCGGTDCVWDTGNNYEPTTTNRKQR